MRFPRATSIIDSEMETLFLCSESPPWWYSQHASLWKYVASYWDDIALTPLKHLCFSLKTLIWISGCFTILTGLRRMDGERDYILERKRLHIVITAAGPKEEVWLYIRFTTPPRILPHSRHYFPQLPRLCTLDESQDKYYAAHLYFYADDMPPCATSLSDYDDNYAQLIRFPFHKCFTIYYFIRAC